MGERALVVRPLSQRQPAVLRVLTFESVDLLNQRFQNQEVALTRTLRLVGQIKKFDESTRTTTFLDKNLQLGSSWKSTKLVGVEVKSRSTQCEYVRKKG